MDRSHLQPLLIEEFGTVEGQPATAAPLILAGRPTVAGAIPGIMVAVRSAQPVTWPVKTRFSKGF